MEDSVFASPLELTTVTVRMLTAIAAGGFIGLDRERKEKTAGLRTCMLVSLAASIFTLLTLRIGAGWTVEQQIVGDPVRIVDAVTAGVAFIAAGAIIGHRGEVKGLTTGAAVWLAGALGLAAGAGFYDVVILGSVFGFLVLTVVKMIEKRLPKKSDVRQPEGQDGQ